MRHPIEREVVNAVEAGLIDDGTPQPGKRLRQKVGQSLGGFSLCDHSAPRCLGEAGQRLAIFSLLQTVTRIGCCVFQFGAALRDYELEDWGLSGLWMYLPLEPLRQ